MGRTSIYILCLVATLVVMMAHVDCNQQSQQQSSSQSGGPSLNSMSFAATVGVAMATAVLLKFSHGIIHTM